MKIKHIKQYLQLMAQEDVPVLFDFCDCFPTKIASWRGVYAEPAIGWNVGGYSGDGGKAPTVKEFLQELELATSGKVYTGWKGGEFTYSDDDTLHVDNPGDCTHTEIISVEIGDWYITLHTQKKES